MGFTRQVAARNNVAMKLAIMGPSGSGKTKSSLLLAYGLVGDWSKITVIDTENGSASLYSDLGNYNVINFEPPYSPERYIEAINACIEAGDQVVIIDSLSHEWMGEGGILQIVDQAKNKFGDGWKNATPRHQALIDKILQSPIHLIATMRSKQEYVQETVNGKVQIKKVGTQSVQRDGLDYEFTIVFELDNKLSHATKDRTQLFDGRANHVIGIETGKTIKAWCEGGAAIAKPIAKPVTEVIEKETTVSTDNVKKEIGDMLLSSTLDLSNKYKLELYSDKVEKTVEGLVSGKYNPTELINSLHQVDIYTDEEKLGWSNLITYVSQALEL